MKNASLINYSHPLMEKQWMQIEKLIDRRLTEVVNVPIHMPPSVPVLDFIGDIVNRSPRIHTEMLIINPPEIAVLAIPLCMKICQMYWADVYVVNDISFDGDIKEVFIIKKTFIN